MYRYTYKFWHFLFGCHFVEIQNNVDIKVCRVWYRADGKPMVRPYAHQIWELKPPFGGWHVTPLTFKFEDEACIK